MTHTFTKTYREKCKLEDRQSGRREADSTKKTGEVIVEEGERGEDVR